jgi:zinc protease
MIQFEQFELANGLRCLVHVDESTPIAAVNLIYDVGARDEAPERTGFAHLFEHLMFAGSKNAAEFDEYVQNAGGESNAFTNNDMTNFYITLPIENLETALWLESDRMLALRINKKSLRTQQKVVVEEFKETTLNEPYGDMWHRLSAMVYTTHPYRWPVIGQDFSHIENATLEEVKTFYQQYYCPNNAIMVIASRLTRAEMEPLVVKWFGDIPRSDTPMRQLPIEPPQTEIRTQTVEANVPLDAVYMAWRSPARLDADYYAVDLLTDVLSGGSSSRLYQRLVKELRLFSEIDCYQTGSLDPGVILIEGKLMAGVSLETAQNAIWAELETIRNEKVSVEEIQKIKNRLESQQTFGDVGAMNKAMNLAFYALIGNPALINTDIEQYQKVTSDDIQRVAMQYLSIQQANVLCYKATAA